MTVTTLPDTDLKPEEFAQAAVAPIADAVGRPAREAAKVLADAGLLGVCADEDDGGLGLGIAFALPIAIEAGRQMLPLPLVEHLLVAKALHGTPEAVALCSGQRLATWALQGDFGSGVAGHARHAADCDWVLVADGQGGAALCEAASLVLQPDEALDPEYPQYWLRLEGAQVLARIDAPTFTALQRDLQVLLAGFVGGSADGALARTAEYMATRVQFGRPLSAKQAVRHMLSRMCLARETSDASVHRLLEVDEFGAERDTGAALAHAIAQSAFVLEKAIHLHGGMGFTWELPLHHGLREVRKFDAAFGAGALARQAGQLFIASVE